MRFIVDDLGYEIIPVVSAVRRDIESWADWSCVRAAASKEISSRIWDEMCCGLEEAVGKKNGAVYLYRSEEVIVLCKDIHPSAMKGVEDYIVQFLAMYGLSVVSTFYDMKKDGQTFMESFSFKIPVFSYRRKAETPDTSLPSSPMEEVGSSRKCRALLVEDDPVTRWLVRSALKGECTLATAHSVSVAVSLYMACKPDIVFLDLNLPDGHGHDAMEQILKRDPGANIVIFSSHDSLDNITASFDEGARGFIAKPFSREALVGYLRKFSRIN